MACHPTNFARLPCPFGSALVSHQRDSATGFHSSGLPHPSGSALILCCSSSNSVFWFHTCTSVIRAVSYTMALQACGVTLAQSLLSSTWVFNSSGSISILRPYCVVEGISAIYPSSLDSKVGILPGWTLGPHLSPPAPGFFLTPPTIISILVSPPVICLFCILLKSLHPPSCVGLFYGASAFWEGEFCHVCIWLYSVLDLFSVFCSCCA